jgi:predicted Zn finger-like uncharacterized protein
MKTKCPHCNTQFKTIDEYVSKKAKCPKCNQTFIIIAFNENETISSMINAAEAQSKDSNPSPDKRQANHDTMRKREDLGGELNTAKQKTKWLPSNQANKMGIAISAAIMIIGIVWVGIWALSEIETKTETFSPYSNTQEPITVTWTHWPNLYSILTLLAFIISPAVCLMLRSFRPKMVLWRGILTLFGGLLIGLAIPQLVFSIIYDHALTVWGIIQILIITLGFMFLRISFRETEKSLKK